MENLNKEALEKLFSGVPKEKIELAMKQAETLSKNPQVRNSFSKISESEITEMLQSLSMGDKQRIASMIGNKSNLSELIKALNKNK